MKTHPLNISYLVVGLVFLGVAGSWGLHQIGVVDVSGVRWLLPLILVIAGVIGLAAFAFRSLTQRDDPRDDQRDDPGYLP
ncbi:MAG TPA: hypothetical protein VFJ09_00075 [Nocardioidaceae bacterium]|nr:hypothetical protein [Nocardioidaceae bacterium]